VAIDVHRYFPSNNCSNILLFVDADSTLTPPLFELTSFVITLTIKLGRMSFWMERIIHEAMHAPKYPENTKAPLATLNDVAMMDRRVEVDFNRTDDTDEIGGGHNNISSPSPPPPPRTDDAAVARSASSILAVLDRSHLLLRGLMLSPPFILVTDGASVGAVTSITVVAVVSIFVGHDIGNTRWEGWETPPGKGGDDDAFTKKPRLRFLFVSATTMTKAGQRKRLEELLLPRLALMVMIDNDIKLNQSVITTV
jgi:hypothetical protein